MAGGYMDEAQVGWGMNGQQCDEKYSSGRVIAESITSNTKIRTPYPISTLPLASLPK